MIKKFLKVLEELYINSFAALGETKAFQKHYILWMVTGHTRP